MSRDKENILKNWMEVNTTPDYRIIRESRTWDIFQKNLILVLIGETFTHGHHLKMLKTKQNETKLK